MDTNFNSVVQNAMALDHHARGELVDKLIVSLANEPVYLEEWLGECERRLHAYERGDMKTVSTTEALEAARRLIKRS